MPMDNLIEYSDNYFKISGSYKFYRDRDKPNTTLTDSESFKFKVGLWSTPAGSTPAESNKRETTAPLKYLRNFWKTLEILLINCKINVILTCSENCI